MNKKLIISLAFALAVCIGHSNAANIADGLVGYWPLDGNGKDQIGKNDARAEKGANFVKDGWRNGAVEKGKIDEVMIFERTLSQGDIQQLAEQGLAVDSVGKLATTWATIKQQ